MISVRLLFLITSTQLVAQDNAARILAMFPVPSISHQVVFRPLTQELARRGHELTIITPDPAYPEGKTPTNITEIDVHDKSYEIWTERFVKQVDGSAKSSFKVIEFGFYAFVDIFEHQINEKKVQDILKSGLHFDLLITEALSRPALILSHIFKAPLIQVSSFGAVHPNYQVMGAPLHPILYPESVRKRIYNLSLLEKIEGLYEDFKLRYLQWTLEEAENTMLKNNFGPDTPTVSELSKNVDMLFLNIDPIFEGIRPVPPTVIHMGGLHQNTPKDLPTDLKNYLDNSNHGVIYMSFGTNFKPSQLPPERIQIFAKVFSKLPYDVLWKWDNDDMPNKPRNVKISKWLPQSDLLRHPKLKLFITQAGLQSTDEAITAGVPLIAFPVLGDQWYNAEKYVHHNIGMKLDLETIDEKVLETSIKDVIEDENYRRNTIRLRELIKDRPQKPLERAIWWSEYVIRNRGAKHLRSLSANISWAEYLMLDAMAVIIAILLLGLGILTLIGNVIWIMLGRIKKEKVN